MVTLAELILERDKERGRWRSQSATPRRSDAVFRQAQDGERSRTIAAQNQPAHNYINEGEARLLAVCGVASPRRSTLTTPSSSRLASGLNSGFQCAHYLVETQ